MNLAVMVLEHLEEDAGEPASDALVREEIEAGKDLWRWSKSPLAEVWQEVGSHARATKDYFDSFTFLLNEPFNPLAVGTHLRYLIEHAANCYWLADPRISATQRLGRSIRLQIDAFRYMERLPRYALGELDPTAYVEFLLSEAELAQVPVDVETKASMRRETLIVDLDMSGVSDQVNDDYLIGWSHAEQASYDDLFRGDAQLGELIVPMCLYGLEARCRAMTRVFEVCGWNAQEIDGTRRNTRWKLQSMR